MEGTKYEIKTFRISIVSDYRPDFGVVQDSEDVAKIVSSILATYDADQEHMIVLFLDTGNRISGFKVLFSGGQRSSTVEPSIVFRAALLYGAVAIILAHNHPSGSITPSPSDLETTKRLKEVGEIIGISVLDHIIIGDGYTSMLDSGMLKG